VWQSLAAPAGPRYRSCCDRPDQHRDPRPPARQSGGSATSGRTTATCLDFSADDLQDRYGPEARYAVAAEARLESVSWEAGGGARGLELGLPGRRLDQQDRRTPTFSGRSCRTCRDQHVPQGAVRRGRSTGRLRRRRTLGPPSTGDHLPARPPGSGRRAIRRISALYGVQLELRVDLRASIHLRPRRRVHIPANIEKTSIRYQGGRAIYRLRRVPVVLGRGTTRRLSHGPGPSRRHVDGKSRRHPLRTATWTPGNRSRRAMQHHPMVPATKLRTVPKENWSRSAIGGGRRAPRGGVGGERKTTIMNENRPANERCRFPREAEGARAPR